jgi:hypothetical protein
LTFNGLHGVISQKTVLFIWKGFGKSSQGQIKVLFQNLPAGTEENYEKPVRIAGAPAEI